MTRRLIWLYCLVWLIEGAIRKWVFPQYSLELLLVRDPLVLAIYFCAARARVFPANAWVSYLWVLFGVLLVQVFIHLLSGSLRLDVAAFGLRTFVLHLPLIWVVPAVFRRRDIILLGKWVLFLAPFLAALMVIQFDLPREHWLNVASLKGGSQLGSVGFKIRPPSIFSFITGPNHYFTLCSALAIIGFLTKGVFPRWLASVGAASVLVALGVAASRGMAMAVLVVIAFGVLAALRSGKAMGAALILTVLVGAAVTAMLRFDVMKEGFEAFFERWTSEEDVIGAGGGNMVRRYGNSFATAWYWAGEAPLIGFGMGSTSNLSFEKTAVDIRVETEWERVIYEIGPVTGLLYLGFRAALSLRMLTAGFAALRRTNYVCILLGAACCVDIVTGNVRQVTTCGYVSICAGLAFAAFKAFSDDEEVPIAEQVEDIMQEQPRARGRGRYAVGGAPAQP